MARTVGRPGPENLVSASGTRWIGTRLPALLRDKLSLSPFAIPLCRVARLIEQPDTRRGLATRAWANKRDSLRNRGW